MESKIYRCTPRIIDDAHKSASLANMRLEKTWKCMSISWEIDQIGLFGRPIAISWHKEGGGVEQNGMRATKHGLDGNKLGSGKSRCKLIPTKRQLFHPPNMCRHRENDEQHCILTYAYMSNRTELKSTTKHLHCAPTTMS